MKHESKPPLARSPRHQNEPDHFLREIMRIHSLLISVFTREVGVSSSRLVILRLLAIQPKQRSLGIMEISRKLGINAAAVVRQITEMEKLELIERLQDDNDKRRVHIQLTEKGFLLFEQLHERGHEFEDSFKSRVDAEDLSVALSVLARFRSYLEEIR